MLKDTAGLECGVRFAEREPMLSTPMKSSILVEDYHASLC